MALIHCVAAAAADVCVCAVVWWFSDSSYRYLLLLLLLLYSYDTHWTAHSYRIFSNLDKHWLASWLTAGCNILVHHLRNGMAIKTWRFVYFSVCMWLCVLWRRKFNIELSVGWSQFAHRAVSSPRSVGHWQETLWIVHFTETACFEAATGDTVLVY